MQKSSSLPIATHEGKGQCWASTVGRGQMTANTCGTCSEQGACSLCTVQINPGNNWGRPSSQPHRTKQETGHKEVGALAEEGFKPSSRAHAPTHHSAGQGPSLALGLPLPTSSSSRAGRKRFWVGSDTLSVCAGPQLEFSRPTGSSGIFHSRPGQVMAGVWGHQYFHVGLLGLRSHLPHSPSFSLLQPHQPMDPICTSLLCPLAPPDSDRPQGLPHSSPELPSRAHVFAG